jgi:hypothetical protein
MSRRYGRIEFRFRLSIAVPPSRIVPAVGSTSFSIDFPTVDFPQPLSPTSPSVSPASTWKETPSTA